MVTDALKNMKQRQSGHAVKGPAYGCSHIKMRREKCKSIKKWKKNYTQGANDPLARATKDQRNGSE